MNEKENRFYKEKKLDNIAPADYVFSVELMNPETGLYEILGVTASEEVIKTYLTTNEEEIAGVYRIQVFTLGQLEGSTQTINSLEEFMEFQQ